jgi:hypothetical protein
MSDSRTLSASISVFQPQRHHQRTKVGALQNLHPSPFCCCRPCCGSTKSTRVRSHWRLPHPWVVFFFFLVAHAPQPTNSFLAVPLAWSSLLLQTRSFIPAPSTTTMTRPYRNQCTTTADDTGKSSTVPSSSSDSDSAAPLYITVGPPCCGKTSWFQRQFQAPTANDKAAPTILDIALDDQRDVYIPVPTRCLLTKQAANENETNKQEEANMHQDRLLLQRQLHGKTLLQRIEQDNVELRLVLQRWVGDLSPEEFKIAITACLTSNDQCNSESDDTHQAIRDWIATVEAFLSPSPSSSSSTTSSLQPPPPPLPLPKETMVFCVESLFRPHPETNQSAIQTATELLNSATIPRTTPIGWGNTNAKARDYIVALDCAMTQKRPVYFVREEVPTGMDQEQQQSISHKMMEHMSLTTLWHRNLQRYAVTGRYLPAMAVKICRDRVDELVNQAYDIARRSNQHPTSRKPQENIEDTTDRLSQPTPLQLDQALTSLAGTPEFYFLMNDNRQITKKYRHGNTSNYRHQNPPSSKGGPGRQGGAPPGGSGGGRGESGRTGPSSRPSQLYDNQRQGESRSSQNQQPQSQQRQVSHNMADHKHQRRVGDSDGQKPQERSSPPSYDNRFSRTTSSQPDSSVLGRVKVDCSGRNDDDGRRKRFRKGGRSNTPSAAAPPTTGTASF